MIVNFDRRVTFERKVVAKDSVGAQAFTWAVVAAVWAGRRDLPAGRADAMRGGLEQTSLLVEYNTRYRADFDSSMRIRDGADVFQITAPPVMLGRREYLQIAAERVTPAGT